MISTEPVETYERRAYINGSSVGTPGTVFAIPVTNPAAAGLKFFYFNTSVANCEVMRSFVIFSRALTAAEVAQVNTLLNA
jgi:hypothetical protein